MISDIFERIALESDIRGHLPRMYSTAVEMNAKRILELGTRYGLSTIAWISAVEKTDGFLWSFDIDRPNVPDEIWNHKKWKFTQGDDIKIFNSAPDNLDILFIDTSHEYQHTLEELRLYTKNVRDGGLIVLHDTDKKLWPEQDKALSEWLKETKLNIKNIQSFDGYNGMKYLWI